MARRTVARALGLPLLILGAWDAIVPFAGPGFGYPMPAGSNIPAWEWSTSHLELHLLPGIAAVVGGLMLFGAFRSGLRRAGALLGVGAGFWIATGPIFSPAFLGGGGGPKPPASVFMTIVTKLGYHYGTGLVMAIIAAIALGLLVGERSEEIGPELHDVVTEEPLARELEHERERETLNV